MAVEQGSTAFVITLANLTAENARKRLDARRFVLRPWESRGTRLFDRNARLPGLSGGWPRRQHLSRPQPPAQEHSRMEDGRDESGCHIPGSPGARQGASDGKPIRGGILPAYTIEDVAGDRLKRCDVGVLQRCPTCACRFSQQAEMERKNNPLRV